MSHVPPALTGGFFIAEPQEQLRISMLKVKVKSLSRVRLFATPWTVGYQAPPSMGFSRQESWSGLPFPSPGDLPNPGIKPEYFISAIVAAGFFTTSATILTE